MTLNPDNLVSLDAAHDALWDELVAASPQGSVFMRSQWLQMMQTTSQSQLCIDRFGIFGKDQKLEAGWAIPFHYKSGFKLRLSYGYGLRYSGPMLNQDLTRNPRKIMRRNQVLALFSSHAAERYDFIVSDCHPEFTDPREFIYQNWNVVLEYYHAWDLSDLDATFSKLESEKRREIRRGLETYQFAHETIGPDTYAAFTALYLETMRLRHGVFLNDDWVKELEPRLLWMQDQAGCRLYTAKSQDSQTIASLVVIISPEDETAYFWMVGSDQNQRDSRIVPSLYWYAAKDIRLSDSRVKFANLGTSPMRSLSHFKDLLGADSVLTFRLIKNKPSSKAFAWHALRNAKQTIRSLKAKLQSKA